MQKRPLYTCLAGLFGAAFMMGQTNDPEPLSNRWFELDHASVGTRIAVSNSSGTPTGWALQHQEIFEGAFLFDAGGKFSLRAAVADGDSMTGGWSNTGAGTNAPASYGFYVKKLYFSAKPFQGLEIQYGGLDVQRGASSTITSYAGDAYLDGARVLLTRPSLFLFDTVSVTKAYFG